MTNVAVDRNGDLLQNARQSVILEQASLLYYHFKPMSLPWNQWTLKNLKFFAPCSQ